MSYEMFLQHTSEIYEISDLDMVVCDEGHRLKNSNINTTMVGCLDFVYWYTEYVI